MNYDTSLAFAYLFIIVMLLITLAGCGDKDRFVERACLDQNGNSVECVR